MKQKTAVKYVPYGINGDYFVYDNELGQIPQGFGHWGQSKRTIQAKCNQLNKELSDKQIPTDKQGNEIGAMEIAYEHTYGKGLNPVEYENVINAAIDFCNTLNLSKLNIRKDFSLINTHAQLLKAIHKAKHSQT